MRYRTTSTRNTETHARTGNVASILIFLSTNSTIFTESEFTPKVTTNFIPKAE
jgi:hypothetical protein